MKLERIPYNPGDLLEFYAQALTVAGAVCERSWHDRLEVLAEGRAATLWNPDGQLHSVELRFTPADATVARDASCEVFPGSPLTFQLAESLRSSPLPLEKFILPEPPNARLPDAALAEKFWRAQFPDTHRFQITAPFKRAFHFSLVVMARCEIQAIDQRWSLHRVAFSLHDGAADDSLARELGFQQSCASSADAIDWPKSDPARWRDLIHAALEQELAAEIALVQKRQEQSLRRELDRIDEYFQNYERELRSRSTKSAKLKIEDRLQAAQAEHQRRRADQVARHEIFVQPHLDALLLIAEPAWTAPVQIDRSRQTETLHPLFIPRTRSWKILSQALNC